MTELFKENGHLTDQGLQAVVAGTLTELQSLEAAEHLSYCDKCLVRYTDLLTADVLETPAQDVTLPVMRRLKQRAARVIFNRYTAAVAAVAIAGTLWYSGALMDVVQIVQAENSTKPPTIVTQQEAPPERRSELTQAVNDFFGKAADAVKNIGKSTNPEPDTTAQEPAQNEAEQEAKPDTGNNTNNPTKPNTNTAPTPTPEPFWKSWFGQGDFNGTSSN